MRRREFIAAMGAGLALPHLPATGADRLTPGIQLYTLRALMAKDVNKTLMAVAEIGYREVEFAGYFGRSPDQIRNALADVQLLAPSAHIDPGVLDDKWSATLDHATVMGHRYLIVAGVEPNLRRTLDDWRRFGDRLNRAGEVAARCDIQVGYHNHDFEFVPLEGRLPYDVLVEATDARLVTLELDLYWITKGGQDPLAYFEKYPNRYSMVHIKDMDATPARGMTDPGMGIIDFRKILPAARNAGVRHWFIEHDEPADPLATARQGAKFFGTLAP